MVGSEEWEACTLPRECILCLQCFRHMRVYWESHMWWAVRNGRRAHFLMNVYFVYNVSDTCMCTGRVTCGGQ